MSSKKQIHHLGVSLLYLGVVILAATLVSCTTAASEVAAQPAFTVATTTSVATATAVSVTATTIPSTETATPSPPTSTPTATAPPPSDTPSPTAPPTATLTDRPTYTPAPTVTATATSTPVVILELSEEQFIILPDVVIQNAREIFARGQEMGRDAQHFSRVGDSIIETEQFLAPFDGDSYKLGAYAYLQPAIDQFAGSFARQGVAVRKGLTSSAVQDPAWSDNEQCEPNETLIACEIRLNNPSVILLLLGTNDSSWYLLDEHMRLLIEYTADQGVIPVLVTKANHIEGDNSYNNVLRGIAADYEVPLLDFDLLAEQLTDHGLDQDGVHLIAFAEADYTLMRSLYSGQGVHSLTALMILDTVFRQVMLPVLDS